MKRNVLLTAFWVTFAFANSAIAAPPETFIVFPQFPVTYIHTNDTVAFSAFAIDPDFDSEFTWVWTFDGAHPEVFTRHTGNIQFKTPGSYLITVRAADLGGEADPTPAITTVVVSDTFRPLNIETKSLPNADLGAFYHVDFLASGGAPPYRFFAGGGPLPPGMTFDTFGNFGGVPSQPGTYPLRVQVVDDLEISAFRDFSIHIGGSIPGEPQILLMPSKDFYQQGDVFVMDVLATNTGPATEVDLHLAIADPASQTFVVTSIQPFLTVRQALHDFAWAPALRNVTLPNSFEPQVIGRIEVPMSSPVHPGNFQFLAHLRRSSDLVPVGTNVVFPVLVK